MTAPEFASLPGVADVTLVRGADSSPSAAPALLVESPHGATRAAHCAALRALLAGPFPEGLQDFFFVNTDVGAPEVASATAQRFVGAHPGRSALVIRCLIPRTFIDCNRVIDAATRPAASAAGQMTPGVAEYVRDAADFRLLFERYSAYRALVTRAFDTVCGAGGFGLMTHTYAPRSIDVPVDERIVERLRAEYRPEAIGKWPLRAEVDLITNAPDGEMLASEPLAARARAAFEREGFVVAQNGAYSLHPSSMGNVHAKRWPGRTLCLEIRRDLLVRAFTPFAEMDVDPAKAGRVASVLAEAVGG